MNDQGKFVPEGAEGFNMSGNETPEPVEKAEITPEEVANPEVIEEQPVESKPEKISVEPKEPKHEYTPEEIRNIGEGIKNFFERMDASHEEYELREVFKVLLEKLNRLSKERQELAKAYLANKSKEAHKEEETLKDAYTKIIDLMTRMIDIINENTK